MSAAEQKYQLRFNSRMPSIPLMKSSNICMHADNDFNCINKNKNGSYFSARSTFYLNKGFHFSYFSRNFTLTILQTYSVLRFKIHVNKKNFLAIFNHFPCNDANFMQNKSFLRSTQFNFSALHPFTFISVPC